MIYDVGDRVSMTVEFKDTAGTLTDPGTIVLKLLLPDGSSFTYTYPTGITKDATGRYSALLTLTQTGTTTYRWEGSTGLTAAGEGQIVARPSAFYT